MSNLHLHSNIAHYVFFALQFLIFCNFLRFQTKHRLIFQLMLCKYMKKGELQDKETRLLGLLEVIHTPPERI